MFGVGDNVTPATPMRARLTRVPACLLAVRGVEVNCLPLPYRHGDGLQFACGLAGRGVEGADAWHDWSAAIRFALPPAGTHDVVFALKHDPSPAQGRASHPRETHDSATDAPLFLAARKCVQKVTAVMRSGERGWEGRHAGCHVHTQAARAKRAPRNGLSVSSRAQHSPLRAIQRSASLT